MDLHESKTCGLTGEWDMWTYIRVGHVDLHESKTYGLT